VVNIYFDDDAFKRLIADAHVAQSVEHPASGGEVIQSLAGYNENLCTTSMC